MSLTKAFRAGFVRRWHTNPDLAHTNDRIDGHAGRVARIILMLHPSPSLSLIRAALIHDDGESEYGDMPALAKRDPEIGPALAERELSAAFGIWGDWALDENPQPNGSEWLKFADRLDAYMWAAHHAPHVMDRDGWPEAADWLWSQAEHLGCLRSVSEIVGAKNATA